MLVAISRFTFFGIFALCVTAAVAGAEIYRWEDSSGELHLVSDLNDVPAQYRAAALAAAKNKGTGQGTLNVISDSEAAPRPPVAVPSDDAAPSEPAAATTPGPGGVEIINNESGGYNGDDDDDDYYDDDARERARMRNAARNAGDAPPPGEESAERQIDRPAGDVRLDRNVPEHPGSIR